MFMVLKKKQLLIVTLVLMLATAGYLNYRYDDTADKTVLDIGDDAEIGSTAMVNAEDKGTSDNENEDTKEKEDYFSSYRMEREKARAVVKEDLEKTLNNSAVSDEAKKKAEQKLAEIAEAVAEEAAAEATLKAKGFEDAVVYISNDSINVTVRSDGLSTADTAKVIDAVYEITKNNNIKIVEVE